MSLPGGLLRIVVLAALLALAACASTSRSPDIPPSYALQDPATTALGQRWRGPLASRPGESGFVLLSEARDAYAARVAMMQAAQKTLDVQYYAIHDDDVGRLMVHEMLAAADRGVRVRVLVDDIHANRSDKVAAIVAAHPGIEVRLFNPWQTRVGLLRLVESVLRIRQLNHRMHNKLLVADNAVAVIGGRNLGDEYFAQSDEQEFRDLDVLAIGPIVPQASHSFDEFWNSPWAVPVRENTDAAAMQRLRGILDEHAARMQSSRYGQAMTGSHLVRLLREGEGKLDFARAALLADEPEKIVSEGEAKKADSLASRLPSVLPPGAQTFWISSPYFIPGERGVALLREMSGRGVDVRILTNSLIANDVPLVHAAYAPYRKPLLEAGVQIYEWQRDSDFQARQYDRRLFGSSHASLHAKAFLVDHKAVFIGSLNVDPRSLQQNTEVGLVIYSPELAVRLEKWFEAQLRPDRSYRLGLDAQGRLEWRGTQGGEEKVWRKEPGSAWWQRAGLHVLGWFPIESQF